MAGSKHSIYQPVSRREMLALCKCGFGSLAYLSLFGSIASSCTQKSSSGSTILDQLAKSPNYIPKAKNIIFLYMDGGVSQVDSFDPKPRLALENGEDPAKKFKVDATQFNNVGKILKS